MSGYQALTGRNGITAFFTSLAPRRSIIMLDAYGKVNTQTLNDGQLLIGRTGQLPLAANLTGSANGVVVTSGSGSISLDTVQPIASTSSPTFNNLSLTTLSVAGTSNVRNLIPDVDATYNLGSATNTWANIYAHFITPTKIGGNLIPDPSNTYDIGSSTNRWRQGHMETVYIYSTSGGWLNLTVQSSLANNYTLEYRDPGANTYIVYGNDFDQLAQLMTTGNPTFNNISTTGTVDGVDLAAFKADFDSKVNQALLTTSSPTFAGQTINGNITVTGTVDSVNISNFYTDYTGKVNQDVRNTAAPTFSGLGLYGNLVASAGVLLDGVDLSVFKADYDSKVNQAVLTTSSPTFADTTIGGVAFNTFKAAYDAFKADFDSKVNQDLRTSAAPTFAGATVNGNVTVTGTVDGVDVSAFKSTYDSKVNQDVRTTASPTFAGTVTADTLVANTAINTGGVVSCQGLTVTSNQTASRQGTNTTSSRVINSLTTDNTSVTSGTFTHLYFSGNIKEYLMHNLSTATGWTSDTTVNQQRDTTHLCFGVFNNSSAINGYLNIQVNSVPSGVYLLEYDLFYQDNTGIITTSVKHSGSGSYVTIRSATDTYTAGGSVLVPFKEYFTVTSTGSCDIRWQALSKNGSSSLYYVYLGKAVRLTKLG